METTQQESKKKPSLTLSRDLIISLYMEQVLTDERTPTSVFKFCKNHNFSEAEFYQFFGSLEGIQIAIWNSFYKQTMDLAHKDASYVTFSNRDKMLTFLYTFFEILTLNRSYVLFALNENRNALKNLKQLKELRTNVKVFAADLISQKNEEQHLKVLKHSVTIFSEGAWLQTLFLLKYWMDDTSPAFENTDVAIEKSVRAIFDVFDSSPLESVLDLGKFLWKENRA